MSEDDVKRRLGEVALDYIETGDVVGVGTGSTVNYFIDALAQIKGRIDGAVASSRQTAERLRDHGIRVLELNHVGELPLYVDSADEATRHLHLIKGGGGALTREKIVAAASRRFVCLIGQTKLVDVLGAFALPVEVLSFARSFVARKLVKMGGQPVLREAFETDNGNPILDVRNFSIMEPARVEGEINNIPGVVGVGIFALRPADLLLIGGDAGVEAAASGKA